MRRKRTYSFQAAAVLLVSLILLNFSAVGSIRRRYYNIKRSYDIRKVNGGRRQIPYRGRTGLLNRTNHQRIIRYSRPTHQQNARIISQKPTQNVQRYPQFQNTGTQYNSGYRYGRQKIEAVSANMRGKQFRNFIKVSR